MTKQLTSKGKFDRWFDNMNTWLDGANKQAYDFNSSLHSKIKAKIADRAERIRRADAVMGDLDFPETTADSEESKLVERRQCNLMCKYL